MLALETRFDEDGKIRPSSVVWLVRNNRLLKASVEQLRKASEREQTLAEFDKDIRLPWAITDIVATLRKNEYDDITQEAQQMPGEEGRDKVARFWLPPTKRHKTKGPVEKPPDNDEEKGDADVEMEGGHSSSSKSLEEIRRDKAQDWDGQLLRDQVEEAQNPQSFLSESKASVELNIPLPKSRHGWMKMSRDPLSFIVNTLKKKSVEVFEKHMDEETKEKFRGAKDTEINKFLRSEALECLPAHLQPSKAEAMSMRWLLSWKVDGDGQTVPKARLVILGYQDPKYEHRVYMHQLPPDILGKPCFRWRPAEGGIAGREMLPRPFFKVANALRTSSVCQLQTFAKG